LGVLVLSGPGLLDLRLGAEAEVVVGRLLLFAFDDPVALDRALRGSHDGEGAQQIHHGPAVDGGPGIGVGLRGSSGGRLQRLLGLLAERILLGRRLRIGVRWLGLLVDGLVARLRGGRLGLALVDLGGLLAHLVAAGLLGFLLTRGLRHLVGRHGLVERLDGVLSRLDIRGPLLRGLVRLADPRDGFLLGFVRRCPLGAGSPFDPFDHLLDPLVEGLQQPSLILAEILSGHVGPFVESLTHPIELLAAWLRRTFIISGQDDDPIRRLVLPTWV
jgi:hypothetical protein